jgi:hypothetical protein
MPIDIMLDLETLSSAPNAAIIAIGATTFNTAENCSFYCVVDAKNSQALSGHVSADTALWWMRQSTEARDAVSKTPGYLLADALQRFREFCDPYEDVRVWGNGADFDNVVLRQAYERLGMPAPWSHRGNRCYRTLKNLRPDIAFEPFGVAHNALDDATAQAMHAERILQALGIVG